MYAISTNSEVLTSYRAVSDGDLLAVGETLSATPPMPSLADCASALKLDVQLWLDATAAQNGYDSLASCSSYQGSSVAQWDADAIAAHAWRDAVWLACFQWQQSASANPPATFPTSAEVIAQLPQPAVYGWMTHLPGSSS